MKKLLSLLWLLLTCHLVTGQAQQLYILDFETETPRGYTTNPAEGDTDVQGKDNDFFKRTNDAGISQSNMRYYGFPSPGEYYFAAQDIDGVSGSTLPFTLTITNINIAGYQNLEFRVYLAEDQDDSAGNPTFSWEQDDYVHFDGFIDGSSTATPLMWVEAVPPVGGQGSDDKPSAIDTNFDGNGDGTQLGNNFAQFTNTITQTGSTLDIVVSFKLDAGEEDIAIDNIEIWGDPIPGFCFGGTATWDGSGWTGTPAIDANVIIAADYNTDFDGGAFEACNLTVNNGVTLTIDSAVAVVVENDVTVNSGGSFVIENGGALVQHNDNGLVTNNGNMSFHRETAPMDAWYEYTYWSSPVAGAQISTALPHYNPNRLFTFNAQNYLDAFKESNNDNNLVTGHDDIDDNGDDWTLTGGNTIMQPGIGYITTTTPSYFNANGSGSGSTFMAIFSGAFNNGIIQVDAYRNDDHFGDTNWNLIGNPYPSAIDSDLFFALNPELETVIYFWSQNAPPSSILNGNQQVNFNTADYAILNGTGDIDPGGDGQVPAPAGSSVGYAIPSGQSFFVSLFDGNFKTGVNAVKITFDNSIRAADDNSNSVFFKENNNSKTKQPQANKLWLNLNSTDNTSNQLLVGYVDGATDMDDGLSYDAHINPLYGALLYSTIPGVDKKFVIQGKNSSSLSENEVIPLGFKTTLGASILYTVTIHKTEGDFFNNHDIFLIDKAQSPAKQWNLSRNDYTFSSSQTGEFIDRFEIVFQEQTLSNNPLVLNPDDLQIIALENDEVLFEIPEPLKIKQIIIYNLMGQQIYNLETNKSLESYHLPNLSRVYIAEIKLSNGQVLTKKGLGQLLKR
ncbi:hypothetical protein JJL45_02270 [Tamlana sp. s12]|uniref:hypothetical protein n=1 Tax=Tamlana sp. s12 TaxID=1630406 RepID=UPI0008014E44|nr:hypothetical protein [Tamlana sp. s12]OBQ56987.1 hypothetical protein VQ01_00400 [Tamlana sp. s12]QQY82838.1 hypothetical protein JJL45_02270 [Tamlana sp. s12]